MDLGRCKTVDSLRSFFVNLTKTIVEMSNGYPRETGLIDRFIYGPLNTSLFHREKRSMSEFHPEMLAIFINMGRQKRNEKERGRERKIYWKGCGARGFVLLFVALPCGTHLPCLGWMANHVFSCMKCDVFDIFGNTCIIYLLYNLSPKNSRPIISISSQKLKL